MEQFVFRPFELEAIAYDHFNDLYPYPRCGHRIVCNDNYIYCIGGYTLRTGVLQEMWKFNRHTLEWFAITATTNMLKELTFNTVCLLEGELLMIFGDSGFPAPFKESRWNKLSVCYPNRTPLEFKRYRTRGKKPSPHSGITMLIYDNHIYTVDLSLCEVHKLNLRTFKWECVYESNGEYEGRYEHGIAYDGNCVYVIGGRMGSGSCGLVELPCFDLKKNSWKSIKTQPDETDQLRYPSPRSSHSCIQYKKDDENFVVISGGYNSVIHHNRLRDYTHHHHFYDDIWRLSLKSYKWSIIQTSMLPKPLFSHVATASGDGCMYIFGGMMVNGESNETVNDVYKIWLKIPKLSTISWEAVLYYYPNLKKLGHDNLLQLGIPLKYVSAIQT